MAEESGSGGRGRGAGRGRIARERIVGIEMTVSITRKNSSGDHETAVEDVEQSRDGDLSSDPFGNMSFEEYKRVYARNYSSFKFLLKSHSDAIDNWAEIRRKAISCPDDNPESEVPAANASSSSKSSHHPMKYIQSNKVNLASVTKNMDKIHWGKFLLCRVVAPPLCLGSLQTIVDDPEGLLAAKLMIRGLGSEKYPDGATIEEGNEILPVGTIIAVKNPVFKTSTDRGFRILIENWKEDLVILDQMTLDFWRLNFVWVGEIRPEFKKYMRPELGYATAPSGTTPPPPPAAAPPKNERKASGKCKAKAKSGAMAPVCSCCQSTTPAAAQKALETDWKRIGNEFFVAKQYIKAVQAYNTGLLMDPGNVDLLSNRAAAYLNTDQFHYALLDCDEVLKVHQVHAKGIFRKVRALWGLKRYEDAMEFLTTLTESVSQKLATYSANRAAGKETEEATANLSALKLPKEVVELASKTKMFIEQSRGGIYNMKEVVVPGKSHGEIDWAEYQFPGGVEVRESSEGRGRGLFATKPMCMGQLILASKAFAYVPVAFKPPLNKGKNTANGAPGGVHVHPVDWEKTRESLIGKICDMILENGDRGRIYELYAGPELGHLDAFTGMNTPLSPLRVAGIVAHNSFGLGMGIDGYRIGGQTVIGVWSGAGFAFLNHACVGNNAHWMSHGDMILVRAARMIEVGEEITISYVLPYLDYPDRVGVCQAYGFTCMCELCVYDRAELPAVRMKRQQYMHKFGMLELDPAGRFGYSSFSVPFAADWLDWLQELRPRHNLHLTEGKAMSLLIGHYENIALNDRRLVECLHTKTKYRNRVAQMVVPLFLDLVRIVEIYIRLNELEKAQRWLDRAQETALRAYGTPHIMEAFPDSEAVFKRAGLKLDLK